jgi:hypothetical protein
MKTIGYVLDSGVALKGLDCDGEGLNRPWCQPQPQLVKLAQTIVQIKPLYTNYNNNNKTLLNKNEMAHLTMANECGRIKAPAAVNGIN